MTVNLSTDAISNIYLGDQLISKAYLGDQLVYTSVPALSFLLDDHPAPFAYSLQQIKSDPINVCRLRREWLTTPEQDFTATHLTGSEFLDFIPEKLDGAGFSFSVDGNKNKCTIANHSDLQLTGDLTIIIHLLLSDWSNGAQSILNKYGIAGDRGYLVRVNGTGKLALLWSNDGTTQFSSTSTVNIPVLDGDGIWLKIDFDSDNDAGGHTTTFSSSGDGIVFTEFDQVTNSGVTQIFPSVKDLILLDHVKADGVLYRVIIKNGIDGATVFDAGFSNKPVGSGEFLDLTGKTINFNFPEIFCTTIYNQGSLGSAGDMIQTQAGRQPKIYDSNLGLIKSNGFLGLLFDGSDDRLETGVFDSVSIFPSNAQLYFAYSLDNELNFCAFDDANGADSWWSFGGGQSNYMGLFIDPRLPSLFTMRNNGDSLTVVEADSSGGYNIYDNETTLIETTLQNYDVGDQFRIGTAFVNNSSKYMNGIFKEAIVFSNDNSGSRTDISDNINNRY